MRRDFGRAEEGSLAIFALILFVLMAMMGGIAVDMMRHEQTRTALQQTIDRSVLAAAALNQQREPEDVVTDYFAKAGLASYLDDVDVREGLNFRTVQATASANLNPFFMHMMGVDQFEVPAASTAEQRITNVEISMVLDVSGSMQGAKITNLKTAARNFVTRVLTPDIER
ncbi:MAG TPA: pilus assembly protein TadG-related protein, partial [Paracoccaceae bacterium]|nr:pilus assembly protein TadG-related protein [Paracoccaceae bacterium]